MTESADAESNLDGTLAYEEKDEPVSGSDGADDAVEESTVPEGCLERCAILFDAALFAPGVQTDNVNERSAWGAK
ncbi:hypothetical protein ABL78_3219 [Leptomonas seymouri]|uniref:Uncharacterized protein n=1 Tax=Leptomonas seymouri TaxID=5684 RepID=A0A0N1HY75_LEPSE|nr:hypothetical protein ABL78_3219 [Leptomonas seymouri]|eukprot:KPI87681.1 hypothetical protein ABL78_3219 [Leptomonas seymouri]